jgi:hypothetical protein
VSELVMQGNNVLVAVMNNQRDMEIAREQHWYRIPVDSVEKHLKQPWTPDWLAFYQTKVFADEAFAIHYYASVEGIVEVSRSQLFPKELYRSNAEARYYKVQISPLKQLVKPIVSQNLRRITFIQTTFEKLQAATEIRNLY